MELKNVRRSVRRFGQGYVKKPEQQNGWLGNAAGVVRVPGRQYYVYVRLWNGQLIEAYNALVPALPDYPVQVEVRNGRYCIVDFRDVFDNPLPPRLADGITDQMTWPGMYTVNIRGEQYLPGLVSPLSGFTVRFYGDQDFAAGVVYIVPPQDIDLTAHIPASGARWVLLELMAGAVQVVEGALAGSVDLLTSALIPAPSGRPLAAVRLYAGQVTITRGKYYSDILDLRTASAAANGDATYLRLDGANSPLTGNVDFGGYQAIALSCHSGDTFPASPTLGQWFLHTPVGRKWLYQHNGSAWQAMFALGASSLYVSTSGSNSQDKGWGTGADAYASIAYAYGQVPPIYSGAVNIMSGPGTWDEVVPLGGKLPTGSFAVNFSGSYDVLDAGTVSSGVQGSGATRGTLTDVTKAWPVDGLIGRFVQVLGQRRVIVSNTATTLTINGTFPGVPSGAYEIHGITTNLSRVSGSALTFLSGTFAHNFSLMKISSAGASNIVLNGSYGQFTFNNCHLSVDGTNTVWFQGSLLKTNITYSYITTTGTGNYVTNAVSGCELTLYGNVIRNTNGIKANNGFSIGAGCYLVAAIGNTFDNLLYGIIGQMTAGIFLATAAGNGSNFFTNNAAGLNITTGCVTGALTTVQFSGNTNNVVHAWVLGELTITALRNTVASLIIKQASGQTTNGIEVQDATGLVHAKFPFPGASSATEIVLNEQGSPYLDFRAESDTEAFMVWLDASADVLYLGGQTNGIKIYKGGRIELIGTATVFDDLPTPLIGQRLESPSSHIVINAAEAALEFKTSCDLTDYVIAVPQITHRWKLGSALGLHLHWEQTSATMPNWLLQYRWQKQGQAKTTAWTSLKWVSNAFTYASGTLNQITGFGTITPPVGYNLSDILDIRILRDVANGSGLFSGVDALAVSVLAKSFDPHVEIDSLGSDTEYAK